MRIIQQPIARNPLTRLCSPLNASGVIRASPSLDPFTGHNPAFRFYTFVDGNGTADTNPFTP